MAGSTQKRLITQINDNWKISKNNYYFFIPSKVDLKKACESNNGNIDKKILEYSKHVELNINICNEQN